MPVLRLANTFAGTGAPNHPNHLAIRGLGLDMVGPLKKGLGGFTHLLVAVDKFTKWIEAKPITNMLGRGGQVLPRHHLSIWCSKLYHHQPRNKLHREEVPGLL